MHGLPHQFSDTLYKMNHEREPWRSSAHCGAFTSENPQSISKNRACIIVTIEKYEVKNNWFLAKVFFARISPIVFSIPESPKDSEQRAHSVSWLELAKTSTEVSTKAADDITELLKNQNGFVSKQGKKKESEKTWSTSAKLCRHRDAARWNAVNVIWQWEEVICFLLLGFFYNYVIQPTVQWIIEPLSWAWKKLYCQYKFFLSFLSITKILRSPKWGKSVWKTCFSSSTFEVDIHFFMRSNEVKYLYCAEVFARVLPIWQSKQEINLMAWLTSDFVEKKLKSLTLFQEFQPITHHKSLENAWYARKQFDAWTEFSQSAVKHFCQTLSPWKSQCVIGIEQIFFGSCISWIY